MVLFTKNAVTLKNTCEAAILLIVLHIYSIPFHGMVYNTSFFNQIATVFKEDLAVGYYISFFLLIGLGLFHYLLKPRKRS
ncbi:hypothetical protein [Streptococcus cameli]